MQVQSLAQEDPLEQEMATHSSILAGIISGTEEPGTAHDIAKRWAQLSMHKVLLLPPSPQHF